MAVKGAAMDSNPMKEDGTQSLHMSTPMSTLLVRDIKERETSRNARPPAPPVMKTQVNGFPAHKRRIQRSKDQQDSKVAASSKKQAVTSQDGSSTTGARSALDSGIDEENKKVLAQMSEEEIRDAKQDLMSGLSPSLIERLLKKANIEEDQTPAHELKPEPPTGHIDISTSQSPSEALPNSISSNNKTSFPTSQQPRPPPVESPNFDPDAPPTHPPLDLQPASSSSPRPSQHPIKTHFPPIPGPPPNLDPSSPTFQASLKEHYFPSLPHDPSTLSWMSAPTPAEKSAYSASLSSPSPSATANGSTNSNDTNENATTTTIPASALRFDFRGRLLPPRLAAQIPTTKGLHHHGHAPEAAGYTIPELAHLARSTVPSQRCVAYQTLGRILYRLGRGDFGQEGEDDLCDGLWDCVERGKVVEGMVQAAAVEEGEGEGNYNRSVWVTATEACWLWRKGGGRKWKGR